MEKLHDTAPGSVWMLQAQGEANESEKNWDGAIIAFNHVLTIDPQPSRDSLPAGTCLPWPVP